MHNLEEKDPEEYFKLKKKFDYKVYIPNRMDFTERQQKK